MATLDIVKKILTLNSCLHPNSVPLEKDAREILVKLWMRALAPFTDPEVEPVVMSAFESSSYPLKPADVVPELSKRKLSLLPWEEAFTEVRSRVLRRDESALPDGPMKDVAKSLRTAILDRKVDEPITILQAQFRDCYSAACSRWIDKQRSEGGVLAIEVGGALKLASAP